MVTKRLWFVSNNKDKIKEIKVMLAPYGYEIKSILDLSSPMEINETGDSFADNAVLKAKTLARLVNAPVIGDDSGLEILALNNFPGIHSARWKGSMSVLSWSDDWNFRANERSKWPLRHVYFCYFLCWFKS